MSFRSTAPQLEHFWGRPGRFVPGFVTSSTSPHLTEPFALMAALNRFVQTPTDAPSPLPAEAFGRPRAISGPRRGKEWAALGTGASARIKTARWPG
jgi:hypothetical protein